MKFLTGINVNGEPAFVRDCTILGTLVVGVGIPSIRLNRKGTIKRVALYVGTPPVGADIIVDVNINGVTIFTTQSNRPKIVAASNEGQSTTIDVPGFNAGDKLRIDIDQIGSGTAGADLWIGVEYE